MSGRLCAAVARSFHLLPLSQRTSLRTHSGGWKHKHDCSPASAFSSPSVSSIISLPAGWTIHQQVARLQNHPSQHLIHFQRHVHLTFCLSILAVILSWWLQSEASYSRSKLSWGAKGSQAPLCGSAEAGKSHQGKHNLLSSNSVEWKPQWAKPTCLLHNYRDLTCMRMTMKTHQWVLVFRVLQSSKYFSQNRVDWRLR